MAYLEVEDGKRVYYEHFAGDNIPVVLVHCWGGTTRLWNTVVSALLGAGHEVVAHGVQADVFPFTGFALAGAKFVIVEAGLPAPRALDPGEWVLTALILAARCTAGRGFAAWRHYRGKVVG